MKRYLVFAGDRYPENYLGFDCLKKSFDIYEDAMEYANEVMMSKQFYDSIQIVDVQEGVRWDCDGELGDWGNWNRSEVSEVVET